MNDLEFSEWLLRKVLDTGEKRYRDALTIITPYVLKQKSGDWKNLIEFSMPTVVEEYLKSRQ